MKLLQTIGLLKPRPQHGIGISLCVLSIAALPVRAADVEVWDRHAITLINASYSGNPFELEVGATFTHTATGTAITMPGFYHSGDTWRINFMPRLTGEWTYVTASADSDLDNVSGSITAVPSSGAASGLLRAGGRGGDKWQYSNGDYVVPVALRMEVFMEPATDSEFASAAQFMQANNVTMVEARLTDEEGAWEGGRHDYIFEENWGNHRFDTDNWDRMERRMDMLREHGLGVHVMFYSDDTGRPGWDGTSTTETLVIRYAVARLAAYPVVVWNTGTDIAEYRSQSDIDWFGQQLDALDPYDHLRSSRRAGGSGSIVMANETFESWGDRVADADTIKQRFEQSDGQPVSMDDAWGENRPSHPDKDHTPADIRRAFWMCLMAGGSGGLIRGGNSDPLLNGLYQIAEVEEEWESEQWLRHIAPFVAVQFGSTYGDMYADETIVSGAGALALTDSSNTRLLFWQEGPNHTYSDGGGTTITVQLAGLGGTYTGRWFDPRTGQFSAAGEFQGGGASQITTPSADDWALLLTRFDDVPPAAPVVDAGGPYSGQEGGPVALDGSGSTDADGDIVAYDWDLDADGAFDDAAGVTATFPAPSSGLFTVGLRVTDADGASDADTAAVTVDNVAPSADAGGPYSGDQGSLIGLDASASSDPGDDIIAYNWDLDADGAFDDAAGVMVTFAAAAPGTYAVGVRVSDADGASDTASVTVTVNDVPPAAPLGLSAVAGDGQVLLDWADNDEADLAGYRVRRATAAGGPYTEIAGFLGSSEYLDTNVVNGTAYYYVVRAEDTAGQASAASAEVGATPSSGAAPDNAPPVAEEQSVSVLRDTTADITLGFADSDGPGPYVFTVLQGPGNGVLGSDDGDESLTYTPNSGFTGPDSFTFRVTDGYDDSNAATVSVSVSAQTTLLLEMFDGTDSTVLGNGWVELEGSGTEVGREGNRLVFIATADAVNRPMVTRSFERRSAGDLIWDYEFDWARTGAESTYRLFMQLGDSALLDPTDWDIGAGVNLMWGPLDGHERFGYRAGGSTTALAAISGPTNVRVIVDLDQATYDVFVDGATVGAVIPLDGVAALDAVRFFTDALNEAHFRGLAFDTLSLTAGSGTYE